MYECVLVCILRVYALCYIRRKEYVGTSFAGFDVEKEEKEKNEKINMRICEKCLVNVRILSTHHRHKTHTHAVPCVYTQHNCKYTCSCVYVNEANSRATATAPLITIISVPLSNSQTLSERWRKRKNSNKLSNSTKIPIHVKQTNRRASIEASHNIIQQNNFKRNSYKYNKQTHSLTHTQAKMTKIAN